MSNMSNPVSRRTALGLAGAALSAGVVSRAAQAQTAPIELKVSHFLPPNHTFHKLSLQWSDDLEKMSGGRLKLKLYPAAQLGPPPRQIDLARSGVADIAIGLTGTTPGRYPMTELIGEAYVTPKEGATCAIMARRLTAQFDEFLTGEYQGVKMLWLMVTSPLKYHTTKVKLTKLEDFKGLRIRYAGEQFAEMITALGATPLAVPPGETQDGLAKGIIDAATFPYEGAQSFDIGTVCKYTLEPGIGTATFAAVMNPKSFAALPADLQALISKTTGPDMGAKFGKGLDDAETVGRDYMLARGVQINSMDPAEEARVHAALAPLLEKRLQTLEAAGKPARKFLAAYVG